MNLGHLDKPKLCAGLLRWIGNNLKNYERAILTAYVNNARDWGEDVFLLLEKRERKIPSNNTLPPPAPQNNQLLNG